LAFGDQDVDHGAGFDAFCQPGELDVHATAYAV
jgi:hypothetical protein